MNSRHHIDPPALYTPATLARIRSAVTACLSSKTIAALLAWEPARVQRVCHAHGIDIGDIAPPPDNSTMPTLALARAVVDTPVKTPHTKLPDGGHRGRRMPTADMDFDEIAATMPRRMRRVFGLLVEHMDVAHMTARELADHCEDHPDANSVTDAVHRIAKKIEPTRWRIESKGGHGGGYRLIAKGEP